ncbi:MAG: HlyD family efflux transporter periplasmic adaptor subunit [Clostridia bacterium]|nr:HlyD family efflux transporter periplasmic adaptor subunit [Clostridia bacterium]
MKKKKRKGKLILLLVILLLLAAIVYFYVLPMFRAEFTTTYDTYTASRGSISNSLSFSGSFSLINSHTYTASADGSVRIIYVTAGDIVAEGDRLYRLSTGETIRADFAGTINSVSVETGDDVYSGDTIMQLADFSRQKVSIRVDEYDINDVSVGQACTITATAQERSFESSISSISYISSSAGNVAYYTAECEVDIDYGVYPGMQATVTIPRDEALDVVVLSMNALSFARDNSAFVYVMGESGEMEELSVELGVNNGNFVEIVSGLEEGDTVYVEAEEEETSTSLLSGLFGSTQINQTQQRGNRQSGTTGGTGGGMPAGAMGGGGMPGGFGG